MAIAKDIQIPKMSSNWAYVLGFLSADGYIAPSGISIQLQQRDSELLEEMAGWFRSLGWSPKMDIRVIGSKQYVRLRIHSVKLSRVINSCYGIPQNKSKVLTWPQNVLDRYLWDYVRGYTDGNGGLYVRRNQIEVQLHSGSEVFLQQLTDRVEHALELRPKRISPHGGCYRVSYYGREARALCAAVYTQEGLKLKRKLLTYQQFMQSRLEH